MDFNWTSSYSHSQSNALTPVVAARHIDILPTELLLNVFSFLPQRDHLEVRAVCRRWAQILSVSSLTFSNSVTFTLDPGTDAYSSLLSAGVTWRRVQINGLVSTTESWDWFRSLAIGSVQRLIFRNAVFTLDFIQSSLLGFSELEELEFINSKMELNAEEGIEAVVGLWEDFLRTRLKSFTVEVDENRILGNFLKLFTCPGSCLRGLIIRMTSNAALSYEDMEPLFTLIRNSSSTLRDLTFTLPTLKHFSFLFPWDCPRMNSLRLRTMDLMLTNLPESPPLRLSAAPLSKFIIFLGSQSDLLSASLPPLAPHVPLDADLAASLPSNLETIHMGGGTGIFRQPQFILKLGKVKVMTVHFFDGQDFNTCLVSRVLPAMQDLTVFNRPGRITRTLANSFPNLRKLIIICASENASRVTVNDTELQLIITGLPRLKVLKLSSCACITDFGVAGIGQQDSISLLAVRAAGLGLDTLRITRKGATLQDLQGLEELSLEGSSQISDVGVTFGLLGLSNLRQLDLSTGNKELTDWALIQLAKVNSRLERMYVESVLSHLVDRRSLEKALVRERKSSGRWKQLDVSLTSHPEFSLKKINLSPNEMKELTDLLEILHQIRTYDNLAYKGNAQPAEVYLQLRDQQIGQFKARFRNLRQAQKNLIRSTSQYEHLLVE